MKCNTIDCSKPGHDFCRRFSAVEKTQPLKNHNRLLYQHFNTICGCCDRKNGGIICPALNTGQKKADLMASIPIFALIGSNGQYTEFPDWVVAVYEYEQDARDHMAVAQAVADKLLEDYKNGLIKNDDLSGFKNEYDPGFLFEPLDGVGYRVETYALFMAGQGIEAVKKWAARNTKTETNRH
jgi:hypothetical protein